MEKIAFTIDSHTTQGGGGIYASGYSSISLSHDVSFISNQVFAAPSVSAGSNILEPTVMGGAILCCSTSSSITITSDGTTDFDNNTAPIIPDMSYSSSMWRQKLVTCDFQGSSNEIDHCDNGKSVQPIWFYAVIGTVVVSMIVIIGYTIHKRRQKAKSYTPILDKA